MARTSSSSCGSERPRRALGAVAVDLALLAMLALLALVPAAGRAQTVQVEMGIRGDVVPQTVDAANLQTGPASAEHWVGSSSTVTLPSVAPGAPSSAPEATAAVGQRFPHVVNPAVRAGPRPPGAPSGLDAQVVPATATSPETTDEADPGGPLPEVATLRGSEGGEWTAEETGPVVLLPLLQTYQGAKLTVRLIDPEGQEVKFGGAPLLIWDRPDDKANAPLEFQGRRYPGSMVRVSSDDYSPRDDLRYRYQIPKGYRLVITLEGQPANSTVITVKSKVLK